MCHFPSEESKKTKVLLCFAERSRVSSGEPWTPQELQVCVSVCCFWSITICILIAKWEQFGKVSTFWLVLKRLYKSEILVLRLRLELDLGQA